MVSGGGKALGTLLREHWKGTWPKLAARAGVSAPALYNWLNGVHEPSLDSLRRLAKAVGLSTYQLVAAFEGEDIVLPDVAIPVDGGRVLQLTIRAAD